MISHPTNSPPKHNATFDKQGGDSTSNEYYHLTEEQIDILEHVTGKHNDLNDIQGGSVGEYYHLTSAEHTVVENTSGVNTGDQESSDFDHNQLQNTHNLTTDIDHNSITNTHNLTTDIDHNSITNTHNLTTDIDHNEINNLQGGDSTSSEYYHLDETEYNNLTNSNPEFDSIKLTTGSGIGKVWTSDAEGNGSWQNTVTIPVTDNINSTGNISSYSEFYDNLGSNIIRTLPDASLNIGKLYFFKKSDSSLFTVAITPLGGDFIDGETDAYLLETEGEFVQLLARNSTSWEVVSE